MVQIIETIDVDVPVRAAYNQWTQFESFPEFLDEVGIDHAAGRHAHALEGQRRRIRARVRRRDHRAAPRRAGRLDEYRGETEHAGVVTFHKLSDTSSRVTVQLDWEPEGFMEKVGALVGAGSHAVKKDLENFKEFIEKRPVETGAWRGDVQA